MDLDWLKSVVDDDDLNLLKLKSKSSTPTADEHLIAKFIEVNDFISSTGRLPKADMGNVHEYMLNQRLNSICNNPSQCESLKYLDIHNLLRVNNVGMAVESDVELIPQKEINSIEDIFSDDDLGLLSDDTESIFNIRNVPKTIDMPDKIAKRKRCQNFDKYEPLFKICYSELNSGLREQHKFTGEQQIQKGQFFILHGIMCYVADMAKRERKNGKVNAKLHLIFENGTESDMLLRSLATELYKDETGRRILQDTDRALDGMRGLEEEDQATGYIYLLQSLSTNPKIQSINNLYKIGYSTTTIEKRIANATNEATYLMAEVKLISGYQCFNMNAQKFENLLHTFFGSACLDVEIADSHGVMCKPREWFIAPIKAIEMAIQLLINGEIINYRYDPYSEDVIERD